MTDISLEGSTAPESSYLTSCDPAAPDGVSTAIVEATADVTGTAPLELDPLVGAIDPDALEAFVRSASHPAAVRFVYEGCDVTVHSEGDIVVTNDR